MTIVTEDSALLSLQEVVKAVDKPGDRGTLQELLDVLPRARMVLREYVDAARAWRTPQRPEERFAGYPSVRQGDYTPVNRDLALELLGGLVHTGLRKGSEEINAMITHRAISADDSGWADALEWAISELEAQGISLCQLPVES